MSVAIKLITTATAALLVMVTDGYCSNCSALCGIICLLYYNTDSTFQATAGFHDSDIFQKAIKIL